MRRTLFVALAAMFLLCSTQNFASPQTTRVKFARGAATAFIIDSFKSYKSRAAFVIRVRQGQTLKVNQLQSRNSSHYVYLTILNPAGEDVSDGEANCNNNKRVENTAAGDYKINVTECRKADAWRGTYKLRFTVN